MEVTEEEPLTPEDKVALDARPDPALYKSCDDCGKRVNIKYEQRHKNTQGCRQTSAYRALLGRVSGSPAATVAQPGAAAVAGTFLSGLLA
jgi:hypothetical protein